MSFHERRGGLARDDIDGRDREENLFPDHLAQAVGGAADAYVGDFRKGVMLHARQLADVNVHCSLS